MQTPLFLNKISPALEFSTVSLSNFCLFYTRLFSFFVWLSHMSLSGTIDLVEAGVEVVLCKTAPVY
jgi:hypothetical protein